MTDLAAQILAALDRAEETAREALYDADAYGVNPARTDDGVWSVVQGCGIEGIGITIYDEGGHNSDQAAHIAANDPAHVLRLTTALREVATMCADQLAMNTPPSAVNSEVVWLAEDTLRALASVWDVPGDNT